MFSHRARAAVLASALALLISISLGIASAPVASAITITANEAASLPAAVSGFRANVVAILRENLTDYGDRLTPAERKHMTSLIGEVNQDLGRLQRATARTATLTANSAPKAKRASAARNAADTFDAGYAKAISNLAEIQPILQPKLNVFEALRAKSQLDTQMTRYEQLGARIHSVDASLHS